MYSILRKIIPYSFQEKIRLILNYYQDMEKFKKYSFDFTSNKTRRHHEADLIFYYHKIEKGLSLPNPRVEFGKKNVEHLLFILENYVNKYGWDDISITALNTLFKYYHFNKQNNRQLDELFTRIDKLKSTISEKNELIDGGVKEVTKADIDKRNFDFKEFAYSRYSIRNFTQNDVNIDLINEAVFIAQKTPSVCNRQPWKVYVYSDKAIKKEILKYQNGNAGFGDDASKILVVTSDLMDFRGVIERNQGYIDGGMYSMSLIYALHSLGVGTCPLNLSITNNIEKRLKKVGKIGDSEILLMMIAVGDLPDKLMVASSSRRKIDNVITIY